MGFGKHGKVLRKWLFGFSGDRPIVIIAIDDAAWIRLNLVELKGVVLESLLALRDVGIV
jgi:PII-like signaling protein